MIVPQAGSIRLSARTGPESVVAQGLEPPGPSRQEPTGQTAGQPKFIASWSTFLLMNTAVAIK